MVQSDADIVGVRLFNMEVYLGSEMRSSRQSSEVELELCKLELTELMAVSESAGIAVS